MFVKRKADVTFHGHCISTPDELHHIDYDDDFRDNYDDDDIYE